MTITETSTIRLEPEKARKVNTVLDLFAQTVQGGVQWRQRPQGSHPAFLDPSIALPFTAIMDALANRFVEYEAASGDEAWVISILRGPSPENKVWLSRLGGNGHVTYTLTGIAALDGLAAAVESKFEGSRAA